jgi:hypothetical protein
MSTVDARLEAAAVAYLHAKRDVIGAGYEWEVAWQERASSEPITERRLLAEAGWVILSAGMSETVARKLFPLLSHCFYNWQSAERIVRHRTSCRRRALAVLRYERKVDAMIAFCEYVDRNGHDEIGRQLRVRGPEAIQGLPYLGPATSRHLAKNLGASIAKPDRHLLRISFAAGFESPDDMCKEVSDVVGDDPSVVDVVLWRYATLTRDYLERFTA